MPVVRQDGTVAYASSAKINDLSGYLRGLANAGPNAPTAQEDRALVLDADF